jgi:phenylacetic acid degradation operon negative regulatory protein
LPNIVRKVAASASLALYAAQVSSSRPSSDRHAGDPVEASSPPALRPQSLMFALLGRYLLGRPMAVFTGSFIDVFQRVGVSEHATRSTLTRMSSRGLLQRYRRSRRVYFGLTPRSVTILEDGGRRVWEVGAVNRSWDGSWTLLAFSLPESWRRQRHDLRSRLLWGGFGLLQSGLWIAPSEVDVVGLIGDLGLHGHVKVFVAHAGKPTDIDELIRDAWDLDGLAARYRAFLGRWDRERPLPGATDDLARQLLLATEWLQLVRQDPRIPVEHLPADWPAVRAEQLFQRLHEAWQPAAQAIVERVFDTIPVSASGGA